MARRKSPDISSEDRKLIGRLLRDLRRAAGYRSVQSAAEVEGCPASRQTIYAYERGGLTPNLRQFLEIAGFYVLEAPAIGAKPEEDLRAHGVATVMRALTLDAYHVAEALDLVVKMQPVSAAPSRKRS